MAATYAVLHFGKPMGETISSFFGGYILGVLALYTRNIWGGVFIHVLLAFGMEVFAYLVTH
jgi:membrane protease YdiL (CAAX protease family)